jgi:hypothetical protein
MNVKPRRAIRPSLIERLAVSARPLAQLCAQFARGYFPNTRTNVQKTCCQMTSVRRESETIGTDVIEGLVVRIIRCVVRRVGADSNRAIRTTHTLARGMGFEFESRLSRARIPQADAPMGSAGREPDAVG